MGRWEEREDELRRTTFANQLTIDGHEHAETTVAPKKRASRATEGSTREAPSFAGEGPSAECDTPMFD